MAFFFLILIFSAKKKKPNPRKKNAVTQNTSFYTLNFNWYQIGLNNKLLDMELAQAI
jgi:hypothetical protein